MMAWLSAAAGSVTVTVLADPTPDPTFGTVTAPAVLKAAPEEVATTHRIAEPPIALLWMLYTQMLAVMVLKPVVEVQNCRYCWMFPLVAVFQPVTFIPIIEEVQAPMVAYWQGLPVVLQVAAEEAPTA